MDDIKTAHPHSKQIKMARGSLSKVPVGVLPLFGIMGVAVVGVGSYLTYLARRPDVVWAHKANPYPWVSVKQDQTTKLMDVNGRFKEAWVRDRF